MSLTVKAFLKKEGTSGEQEIRRFTIDHDVSTNFIYLTKKLVLVYPALQDKTFHLRWKDSENDLVLFSSDEELTQALGFVDDGVFKIYIEEVHAESGPKSSTHCGSGGPQNVFHPGVKCDGCEGPVYGTRFKCQTCPNFDLCGGCRQTGLHVEHAFDDIHAPTNPFNMFEGHMEGSFQAMPQLWFQGGMTPPMFHHFGQDPNENQRRGAPWHGGCRATRKAWRKWYREMYNDYEKKGKKHGHKHGCTHDSEKKKAENMEAETSGEPSTAEKDTAREAEPEKKHDDDVEESSSDEGEGGEGEGGEGGEAPEGYLRTIGKSVTDFLKPFGIDVEAFVKTQGGEGAHHHGPTSGGPHHSHFGPRGGPFGPHCRPYGPRGFGPRGGCHGPERGSFRCPRGSFGPRGGAFGPHGAPWSNEFSGRGGPFFGRGGPFGGRGGPFGGRGGSCRPEFFGPHGGPSGHPAGGQFRCHFGQFGHEGGQWGPYNMGPQDTPSDPGTSTSDDATGSQGQGAGQGHQSTDSAEQQNKMDQDAPPNAGDAARETGEEGSATSSHLPQNSDELLIAEVVNTMKGMGFGDDGGWLTTLVRAHGGDMGRALDAIHATRQN